MRFSKRVAVYTVLLLAIAVAAPCIYKAGPKIQEAGSDSGGEAIDIVVEAKENVAEDKPREREATLAAAGGPAREQGPFPGMVAPDFKFKDLDGREVSLADYKGKVLFVNLWATWCPWCIIEMPEIQKIKDEYAGKVELLSIAVQDDKKEVRSFLSDYGYDIRVVLDPVGRMFYKYYLRSVPASFIIDGDGVVRFRRSGMVTFEMVKEELDKIIEN